MDFISAFLSLENTDNLLQLVYICLLLWTLVIHIPRKEKNWEKERKDWEHERKDREDSFKEEREVRDSAFLETINSYRKALTDFQEKEDQAHALLIEMVKEHDNASRKSNEQIFRSLKAIANKLGAELLD